jgi:hypothetical protein
MQRVPASSGSWYYGRQVFGQLNHKSSHKALVLAKFTRDWFTCTTMKECCKLIFDLLKELSLLNFAKLMPISNDKFYLKGCPSCPQKL